MPFWRLYYHLVWGTKNRYPLIDEAREETIRRSIRATCEEHRALVHGIGVMPDHVHLSVSIPPRISASDFIQFVKGSSSHLINQIEAGQSENAFAWQAEYGVLSFGERSLEDVVAYVEHQREHHAENTTRPNYEQLERPYDPKTPSRS
jgi:putative transposase